MPSSFSWIDFAEDDRHRMMEILYLFREREIREELGIGTIRDAFSDTLFPGTSTLHTRARYFLFIPWIFMKLEEKRVPSREIESKSRDYEIKLIDPLINSGEKDGVIGYQARSSLKILPSYMYWSGLGVWGIRKFDGSRYQYFRSLDSFYFYQKSQVKSDDNEHVLQTLNNWDPDIVPAPRSFPNGASFDLSRDEATYLRDKVLMNCANSALAFLVREGEPTNVDFIWQHPLVGEFPEQLKEIVENARKFSMVMHGASILYNLMLMEKRKDEEEETKYRDTFDNWAMRLSDFKLEIKKWDLDGFWNVVFTKNPRIPPPARRFVMSWIRFVLDAKDTALIKDDQRAKKLIYQRESRIKGKRARLKNKRMLDQWSGESAMGALSYRWRYVQRLINDIHEGIRRE